MADLLRIATAGSVDDGKSTLIGRLLHDSKSLMADEVEAMAGDLARITDGLRAEREQGITIDVAYRYFTTPRRRFVLADCPGHARYTRNMVTGASTADLALVLADAARGLTDQSRRHAAIARLLRVRHVVVAVNKMDLVGWDEEVFDTIVREACELGLGDATFVPVSALHGDNVVDPSANAPWYGGPTLLEHLESVPVGKEHETEPARLPVQLVIRAEGSGPGRRYAGRVAAGVLRPGDEVVVGTERTRVVDIHGPGGPVDAAPAGLSVTVTLADDLDVARGALIAAADDAPEPSRDLAADACWLADAPSRPGGTYLLRHGTATVRAKLVHGDLALNELGPIRVRLAAPVAADPYSRIRATGAFILIDETTNDTVAAGMVSAA
jgi:sulfate adenylyltransferase large subunit